jgi:hypothetical protein
MGDGGRLAKGVTIEVEVMELGELGMAIAKLKTGETIELPFEEMLTFIVQNGDLIEKQQSQMPRRRLYSKAVAAS